MRETKPQFTQAGTWRVRYRVNGERKSKTFKTQAEAYLFISQVKYRYQEEKKTNLRQFTQKFMCAVRQNPTLKIEQKEGTLQGTFKQLRKQIKNKEVQTELQQIDIMTGEQFERYCSSILPLTGYFNGGSCGKTMYSGDYGVDIVLTCADSTAIAIQCKRIASRVGVDAVQQVYTGKSMYKCTQAAVITNSFFTKAARQLASKNGVVLIDRQILANLIDVYLKNLEKMATHNQWVDLLEAIGAIEPKKGDKT